MARWEDYKNSFDGQIEWIPDINVDDFYEPYKKAYFVSHIHSDHYGGLAGPKKGFDLRRHLKNSGGKVYMSWESKIIFENKHNSDYQEVKNSIVVLEKEEEHYLEDLNLYVTLIPVVHMLGAVMFLFKTLPPMEKSILYTGDFYFNNIEDLTKIDALHGSDQKPIKIDLIYYDATFIKHKNLPEQIDCIKAATKLVSDWLLKDKNFAVSIETNYDYAYERLFYGIVEGLRTLADEFKDIKISLKCHEDVFDTYGRILDNRDEVFTKGVSRIHKCICANKQNHDNFNELKWKYLNIKVATLTWQYGNFPLKHKYENFYDMCYPTHCRKDKLKMFKEYFRPEDFKAFPKIALGILEQANIAQVTLEQASAQGSAEQATTAPVTPEQASAQGSAEQATTAHVTLEQASAQSTTEQATTAQITPEHASAQGNAEKATTAQITPEQACAQGNAEQATTAHVTPEQDSAQGTTENASTTQVTPEQDSAQGIAEQTNTQDQPINKKAKLSIEGKNK